MTEVYKKYLDETTTSTDVANYDKKIGDEGNSQKDFVEIVLKNESFMETINTVTKNKDVSVTRNGNLVTIEGSTEVIKQIENTLIEMGVR